MCGLCLPHCPTYRLVQDESESPRGRISLMRAVAGGALPASETLITHLSHCLDCRACERACPSGVRYGKLIAYGRELAAHQKKRVRLGLWITTKPLPRRALAAAARLYQRSGLRALARAIQFVGLARLRSLDSLLPDLPPPLAAQQHYPANGTRRARVLIFAGCLARELDRDALSAAIRILTRCGMDVDLSAPEACCGALHRDAGETRLASELEAQTRELLAHTHADIIITLNSGCGARLTEQRNSELPIRDINTYLAELPLPDTLRIEPLSHHVAVHDPCSLRNSLRGEQAVYALLRRIPDLTVTPLPENQFCCGGAGAYPLREPEFANRLREPKLAALEQLKPDLLVSANIGCALHISAGLRAQDCLLPVVHPVVLFERQLHAREN